MARIRKRRRLRRKPPAVRRPGVDLMVGGAKDPAEGAADRLAAKALAAGAHAQGAAAAPVLRRSAPKTALAPGSTSAAAPKGTANLVTSLGTGRALNAAERGYFEPRFDADLSGVRLHEGRHADRATRALDADAFSHGPDIAFASGKRDRATMAHELAHTVQNRSPKLRRKIVTEVANKKNSDLRWKLRHDYGVKNIARSGNDFTLPKANVAGSLNNEIASSMLASTRTFTLVGTKLHRAEASLRDHLKARRGIVKLSKAIRVDFPSGSKSDNLLGDVMKFINDEVGAKLKKKIAKMPTKPDPETYKKMVGEETIKVLQKYGGSKEIRDAVREIRKKSRAYDRLKKKPFAKPFVAACFSATATVMYGGSDSAMKKDKVPLPKKGENVMDSALINDWVPGDWGYIQSYIVNPSYGLEGENIIYVGKGLFWGHFSSVHTPEPLFAWITRVSKWEQHKVPKKKRGMAKLLQLRKYPRTGLR